MGGHNLLLSAARAPEASYRERRHKADAILQSALHHLQLRREQGDAGHGLIYADTSHLFLKTFADVVMVGDWNTYLCVCTVWEEDVRWSTSKLRRMMPSKLCIRSLVYGLWFCCTQDVRYFVIEECVNIQEVKVTPFNHRQRGER